MANEYDKNNILKSPELSPERHYESEGVVPSYEAPQEETDVYEEEPLLEVLDDLDRVYRLAALLPPGLADIIRRITRELSLDTQGKIIQNIQTECDCDDTSINDYDCDCVSINNCDCDCVSINNCDCDCTTTVFSDCEDCNAYNDCGVYGDCTEYGDCGDCNDCGDTTIIPTNCDYTSECDCNCTTDCDCVPTYKPIGTWVVDTKNNCNDGEYITDIFSDDPIFTISSQPIGSLVDLSRKAYLQDDADIKKYFTSRMIDMSHRFFQVMDTIATEAGMPDHSYLMQNFDGTAVKTTDPNKQHLIDYISKSQIIYDQKERFMNKTHTAKNTLIYMRSMNSSEAQRERYLAEEYSDDVSTYAKDFSNDILEKSRNIADDNYKQSAYSFFKYLNSATELTNTMLNMKIDEGAAKAELAASGSDIYAFTPPPAPTTWNIDDNKQAVDDVTKKTQEAVESQAKDAVTAAQALSGGGTNGSFIGGASVDLGGGVGTGSVEAAQIYQLLRKCGYNKIAACGIMGNIEQESTFNTRARNSDGYTGLCQWDPTGRWANLVRYAQSKNKDPYDASTQIEFMYSEAVNTNGCSTNELNAHSTPEEAAVVWDTKFERSGGSALGNRKKYARKWYNSMPD